MVLRRSIWLHHLTLRNCGLKGDFVARLGRALEANEGLALIELDLGLNALDDAKVTLAALAPRHRTGTVQAVGSLAAGLASAGRSLARVELGEAGLTAKGLAPLTTALFRGQASAPTLTKLSLAANPIHESPVQMLPHSFSTNFDHDRHLPGTLQLDCPLRPPQGAGFVQYRPRVRKGCLSHFQGYFVSKMEEWGDVSSYGALSNRGAWSWSRSSSWAAPSPLPRSPSETSRRLPSRLATSQPNAGEKGAGLQDFLASAVALSSLDLSEAVFGPEVLKAALLGLASNTQISDLHLVRLPFPFPPPPPSACPS